MGILNLVKEHGPDRLEKACEKAHNFGFYSYRRIKNILDRGLEEDLFSEQKEHSIPLHENVRGNKYYR